MQKIPYELKRSFTGGHVFIYRCPSCREGLRSGLKEVGTEIQCPNEKCDHQFIVPGMIDKKKLEQSKTKYSENPPKPETKTTTKVDTPNSLAKTRSPIQIETNIDQEPMAVETSNRENKTFSFPKMKKTSAGPGPIEREIMKHQRVATAFRTLGYSVVALFCLAPMTGSALT